MLSDNISPVRDAGRNLFHVRFISWSYRRRGNEARTQTNQMAMRSVISEGKII